MDWRLTDMAPGARGPQRAGTLAASPLAFPVVARAFHRLEAATANGGASPFLFP
jgi:hypothetical protein